jgi:sulfite reductase (ferredoxin)
VAFVEPEHVVEMIKAIVTVHRDFGDRTDRKHARLKYVLHEWGVEKFRQELQTRVSFPIELPREMPAFVVDDHLGWHQHGPDAWSLGVPIDSGRIGDDGAQRIRTGIRDVVSRFVTHVQLTAQQNILLSGIRAQDREAVEATLDAHGVVTVGRISPLRRNSLACPALPTCGLAISEAERVLPRVLGELEQMLAEVGLPGLPVVFRMTGCPNGCARPYVAEVALVGRSLDKYMLYLGGDVAGTRLARPFLDLVPLGAVAGTLKPLFEHYRDQRRDAEDFGDFCDRLGLDTLKTIVAEASATPVPQPVA